MGSIASNISYYFDVDVNAVILLLSVLAAFPINLVYVFGLQNRSASAKLTYFLLCGLVVTALTYHENLFHSFINCVICYLTLKHLAPRVALTCNFVFTLIYLMVGYRFNQVDWNYSITWTIPQCILTLKLIAFSFDVYDGHRLVEQNKKSDDKTTVKRSDTAIDTLPDLLQFLSFCYFSSNFTAGPLIPYTRFAKFIEEDSETYNPKAYAHSFVTFVYGVLSLAVYLLGCKYWPLDYVFTEEYANLSLFWKWTSLALITKLYLHKYIQIWFFSHSACTLAGITWNGENFNDFCNIDFWFFEKSLSFTDIIKSYNITTNKFSFKYVYRRLKFLGNPKLSQILTLAFLSVWHGFETGYHFAFSIEFLIVYFEKHFTKRFTSLRERHHLNFKYFDQLTFVIGKLYTFYFTGYSFAPFMYLYFERWFPIMKSLYFIGHIFLIPYVFLSFFF